MKLEYTYKPLEDSQEAKQLGKILCQCFPTFRQEDWEEYQNNVGRENFRLLCQDKEIIGGLAIYFMGQYIGGKSIPIGGIATVGIAPQYRGQKAANSLMKEVLKELESKNIPLSTLYPATQQLYRGVGYEQGGFYCQWEIPLSHLSLNNRVLPMEKILLPHPQHFTELYQKQACQNNGYLDRCLAIWQSILNSTQETIDAYWIGEEGNRQGYIICQQTIQQGVAYLQIKDWAALNSLAIQRLWTFISDHRSQIDRCQWNGAFNNEKMLLLPEQIAHLITSKIWLIRIVNVIKALEMRPYPSQIEIELDLAIEDPLMSHNSSNFRLQVSKGKGKITQGNKKDLKLTIQALASLYTGFFTPQQLSVSQQLEGNDSSLDIAHQLFTLPNPSLADFF